jgi:hypothetical protein
MTGGWPTWVLAPALAAPADAEALVLRTPGPGDEAQLQKRAEAIDRALTAGGPL